MKSFFLSRFTPSLVSPEILEAIFVQREPLAEDLVERIRSSAFTSSKHYSLLIGPRGIGKTHLVSLVHHRVQSDKHLVERLICAWLREEEWGITSFLDLLISILRAISQTSEDSKVKAGLPQLFEMQSAEAELAAEQLLLEIIGDRTLLVLVENLDQVFEGMGETGQQKLRAFIQNNPCWTILGTSQSLFKGVSLQDSPFYGFFEVTHLREFSFEDAVSLLVRIAQHQGDQDLARSLRTTSGRSRIRAAHHLAEGNPRVYVILSQFLTHSSLEQLVEPLMQTLDDLTPYYQARMSYLSPQQRKLVEFLCDRRGAVSVKEIAKHNFLADSTTSSQLARLRELGYVRPARVGRESFFELREPLMRLSLEVKRQRGEPIRLLVDFLRLWFSQDELRERLDRLEEGARVDKRYLLRAMKRYGEGSEDPRVEACLSDYDRFWNESEYAKALQVAEELTEIRGFASDLVKQYDCLERMGETCAAEQKKEQALVLEVVGISAQLDRAAVLHGFGLYEELLDFSEQLLREARENAAVWHYWATALYLMRRYEEAIEAFEHSIELNSEDAATWNNRGLVLRNLDRGEEALGSFDRALQLKQGYWLSLKNRMDTLITLGRPKEALVWADRMLDFHPEDQTALEEKRKLLYELDGPEEALLFSEKLLKKSPDQGFSWLIQGRVLLDEEKFDEASLSFQKATRLSPDDVWAWQGLAGCLDSLGRYQEALAAARQATKLRPSWVETWAWLAICQYRRGKLKDSLESLDRALEIEPLDPELLSNRGVALSSMGRQEEALEAFDQSVSFSETASDFQAESNRAVVLMLLDRWDEGREALDQALQKFSESEIKEDGGEIAIVRNMLIRTQREETWRRHIAVWIEIFERRSRLTFLGQGLVRTIRTLTIPWITVDMARTWNSVWQDLGAGKPELTISLRLFDAAVQYREGRDERVLLALPAEERALLRPLLEVAEGEAVEVEG